MKLSLFHTPELTPTDAQPSCAIVIDVLRATSTIATAFHVGAEAVQAFSSLEELMERSESWPASHRLRAGERGGKKVEGCDLGNSPLDCTPELFAGRRMFMSTTNGTRALQCVQGVPLVVTAALVNRQRVVQFLQEKQPETVWMVGSGWEGSFSLEDTVCAGAIASHLATVTQIPLVDLAGNDEVVAAVALFDHWRDRLVELLHHASHGQRLLRLGTVADLEFCAQLDVLDVLPMQREPGVLVKC